MAIRPSSACRTRSRTFESWLLHAHCPDRAERILHRIEDMRGGRRNDPRFGTRMRGTGLGADLLEQCFDVAA